MSARRKKAAEPAPQMLPEPFAAWFAARGWAPRPHQLGLLERARAGQSTLLIAPTGAGKTLAGFLPSLIDLHAKTQGMKQRPHRLHTLYVSPLKALTTDVARNLQIPAVEMKLGLRIETRTGDTPSSKRTRQRAHPPDILLTTPEQVCLLIASQHASVFFEDLEAVIVDEAHALAPTKRGDLLALALARLRRWAPGHRRIGLSATVADPPGLARWLMGAAQATPEQPSTVRGAGGMRRGSKADPATAQNNAILVAPPGAQPIVDVLDSREKIPWAGHSGRHNMAEVYEAIGGAKLALVFVNTRAQAEMTFQELWRINEQSYPIALHHGSLDVGQRRRVEHAMAAGTLRAVVCTSTLDLGIDWGDVDLVIQMGAPKGAARLVQRIGRANHRLDEPSRALLAPSNRFEVLECRAAQEAVMEGALDGESSRIGGLDCLAQHVMGCACGDPFDAEELYEEVISTAPYANLSRLDFEKVVDCVATGGYSLRAYDRYKRIVRDPKTGLWGARTPMIAQKHRMNVGAIVEAEMLNVVLASRRMDRRNAGARTGPMVAGRKLGQIEEWFIEGMTPGDTFLFAGQILRMEGVRDLDVLVSRAQGEEAPRIPSYAGGKFPLSTFLAERVRRIIHDPAEWPALPKQVQDWIGFQQQRSVIPEADHMLVETFPRANKYFMVCYPFEGRLAHQTLGMLLTRRLERMGKHPLGFVASEYALSIWAMSPLDDVNFDGLFDQDMLGDDLDAWLAESALMKRTFRTCAIIAGMIERRQPGEEAKSGRAITFSADLIYDVLRTHEPDHILLQAAFADAGQGFLDIHRLGDLLRRVKGKITHAALPWVSPFAVPVMLEIGREPVFGSADDAVLADAATGLIAEALGE